MNDDKRAPAPFDRPRLAPGESEPVLAGKSATVGGRVLIAVGLAIVAGGVYGAVTGGDAPADAAALAVLALVFGGGLAAAGALLASEKGGVSLAARPDGEEVLVFRGAGRGDALLVPCRTIDGARLVPRDEVWGREPTRSWSCELLRGEACPVVLAESSDYEAVWAVGRSIEGRLGVRLRELESWDVPRPPSPGDDAAAPEPTVSGGAGEGQQTLRVRRGGPLARVLLGLGLAGVVVGAVLMGQVEKAPVFGFLFGPTLFFLGLALGGAAAIGWLGTDVVRWTRDEIHRRSRLGPFSWGAKSLPRTEAAYLRLHPRGLLGASLELVGRERTLVLVGGVTRFSKPGYVGLLALADALGAALPPAAAPSTGPDGPAAGGGDA